MSQKAFNGVFSEIIEGGADNIANKILTLILAFAMDLKEVAANFDAISSDAQQDQDDFLI